MHVYKSHYVHASSRGASYTSSNCRYSLDSDTVFWPAVQASRRATSICNKNKRQRKINAQIKRSLQKSSKIKESKTKLTETWICYISMYALGTYIPVTGDIDFSMDCFCWNELDTFETGLIILNKVNWLYLNTYSYSRKRLVKPSTRTDIRDTEGSHLFTGWYIVNYHYQTLAV